MLNKLVSWPENPLFLNGLTIKRCAVAFVADCNGFESAEIFSSAFASPYG